LKLIGIGQLQEMRNRGFAFVLVNVVSRMEYLQKHIPGSVCIPYGKDFESTVKSLFPDPNEDIVLYSGETGPNSIAFKAAKALQEMGYADLLVFDGGAEEWANAGLELHQGGA